MKLKIHGAKELVLKLRNMAIVVPDNARKVMHKTADKVVKEAKLNAPVDKHNLEESIRKQVAYAQRGRLKIDIIVGGSVNGVNVDEYATEVHERYSSMTPGKGTLEKMKANPGRLIGEKFLDRAFEDNKKKLIQAMIAEVNRATREIT